MEKDNFVLIDNGVHDGHFFNYEWMIIKNDDHGLVLLEQAMTEHSDGSCSPGWVWASRIDQRPEVVKEWRDGCIDLNWDVVKKEDLGWDKSVIESIARSVKKWQIN
jgi:hypothetical protein